MQDRVLTSEDGKDSSQRTQSRVFPSRILKFLTLFVVLGVGFCVLATYITWYFNLRAIGFHALPVIKPCVVEEQSELRRWIKPPPSLMHNMSDEELFWRACFAPQVQKYPFKRVPKVAFMFLTRGPLPLSPLWEKFFKGHEELYSIYIHSLPGYQPNFLPSSVFYKRQIPSKVAEWGKMSMCDAERRLLANALLDLSNEWFALLSESCIPLYNFNITYQYLMRSRYSFVGSFDDPGPHGRGRYNPRMTREVNITQWRKGAQWFAVNRKLAIDIVSDAKYYPKFRDFCRSSCYVDEHYFPTMLTIESPHLMANRTVTWVDWSRGGAHPATFGRADVTEAFLKKILKRKSCFYNDQPSSVCFLFARKFSPNTLEPLLQFAPSLLGFK
ncbi:glycosyltransferase BC10-like [Phoenix dactylifera]|uniref:Glycosyltransferase BC10-like n=1 Tax=Phoenix dactylifera TaxID=42345 RepID=A0A8B7D302_PHODC|nr:glycosyltransferase BC10-like [Phoenix dactylifera]XP_008812113.2 glycosyltransferase BC10-like [Phoenix dactylifera]